MVHPLTQRLIAFRAAYYRIQIIRGLLLTGLWSLLLLLLFSLSEGVFWWEVSIRQILWVIWLGGIFFFLGRWVVYPLLQYGLRLRGYLSDEEAARWIGRRLPEVRDTLLNAIQLHSQHAASNAAIALAIEERTRKLSVLPWEITLPRADIRRYGLFLLLTVLLSAFLWIASPTLFRGGALRFLQPHQAFLRPVPYTLRVEGLKPFYRQGEPLELFFFLSGEKLPAELYASSDEGPLPLQRKSPSTYTLALPSLQSSFTLHIEAPGELHREYPILVQKPLSLIHI
ncbi:MAG: hypothetical protein N2170_08190, partial [Bacteroidia bacterium]|nr:hypothetical protein [Bacteroidia bacterium]